MAKLKAQLRNKSKLLKSWGLPPQLITMIGNGSLVREVEEARKRYNALNDALDVWEKMNPAGARVVPWFEQREAWKKAGRPEPGWYELLISDNMPLGAHEISYRLLRVPPYTNKKRTMEVTARRAAKGLPPAKATNEKWN